MNPTLLQAPRPAPARPRLARLAQALLLAGAGCQAVLPLAAALLLPAGAAQAQVVRGRSGGAPVTLNFVNAEVEAVSRAMAVMTGRQIVVDPRVRGQVTLYSEQPMSVGDAWRQYTTALRGLGFAIVESGGLVKVVPEADAKLQTSTVRVGEATPRGDQIVTQVFRLTHENPNNLVAVLRPLISPNNTINANPGNNSLVITDYADNLGRLGRIIAALDQPTATDVEVIPLRHAIASDLAPLIQRLGDGGAGGGGVMPGVVMPGAAAGGALAVNADPRTNSLIVRAPNQARLATVRGLVARLDVPGVGGPSGQIHVVYLKNADATRLAAVLRAAFAGVIGQQQGGAGGGVAGAGGGFTQPTMAQPSPQPLQGGTSGGAGGASAAATTPVSQVAPPSTGGFVQADPATNSLVITAPDPLYRQIRAVIDQLDGRRAQVYVESMIVKVDADKMAQFGFQWQGLLGKKGDSNIPGMGTNFSIPNSSASGNILDLSVGTAQGIVAGAATARATIPNGFNIGVLSKIGSLYTLGALATFLETNTDANILSTPNLVALDNEEAKIVIGQNVPFITGSFTNTGTSGASVNPFQTYERKDVGLTLRIKSQIGEGGTIRMTVYQENSSIAGNSTGGLITDKSAIETSVLVDDGQIMVLGGLLKDEYTDGTNKVPGLGDLPVVGNLFKSEQRKRVKSNLLVFLRPTVLRSGDDSAMITADRYDMIRARQQQAQPVPSTLVPVNEAPVLPPLPTSGDITPLGGRVREQAPDAVPPIVGNRAEPRAADKAPQQAPWVNAPREP